MKVAVYVPMAVIESNIIQSFHKKEKCSILLLDLRIWQGFV